MKKYITTCLICLTFACFFALTIYSFWDTNTVSQTENRKLTTLPKFTMTSWKDGSFQEQMDSFLSDHIYGRNQLLSFANDIEGCLRLSGKPLLLKDVTNEDRTSNLESEYLLLEDRILYLYLHNDESFLTFYNSSNELFNSVPEDVRKFYAICPKRIEFETAYAKQLSDSAKADIELLYENSSSDITTIPVFTAVETALQEQDLNDFYYRTDHHWTALCSYYAANAFLTEAGKNTVSITDYNQVQEEPFQGYLTIFHNMTDQIKPDAFSYYQRKDGNNPPETVYWRESDTGEITVRQEKLIDSTRGGYYTFVERSQFAYTTIDGLAKDQSCLLMVSDSYGFVLSTWLIDAYDTILLVDPRYYDTIEKPFSELFDEYSVTDFLFCVEEEQIQNSFFNQQITDNLLTTKE